MPSRERRKGLSGELEVRRLWESHGFTVRGLEGSGDHFVLVPPGRRSVMLALHSEVKRTENARPRVWMRQAEAEAPPGAVPVVSWRPSRSPWYSILRTEDLARLLA